MILYFPDITPYLMSDYTHLLIWYRVTHGFNLPIGYSKLDVPVTPPPGYVTNEEWDSYGFNSSLELPEGSIIGMGSMSYQDTDRTVKKTNVCLFRGKLHPFGTSFEFYEKNKFLFENITSQINRDKKITKILN